MNTGRATDSCPKSRPPVKLLSVVAIEPGSPAKNQVTIAPNTPKRNSKNGGPSLRSSVGTFSELNDLAKKPMVAAPAK